MTAHWYVHLATWPHLAREAADETSLLRQQLPPVTSTGGLLRSNDEPVDKVVGWKRPLLRSHIKPGTSMNPSLSTQRPHQTKWAGPPSSASPDEQYLSPADLENAARRLLARDTSHSLLSMRVAAWGAFHHGNSWFRIHDARVLLDATGKKNIVSGKILDQLKVMGICDTRTIEEGGRKNHEARITCQLYSHTHPHGRNSAIVVDAMNRFASLHACATPFALLLLIGAHVYQFTLSVDLGRYLAPTANLQQNPTLPTRILKSLDAAGLVQIHRIHSHHSRPFLVFPVGQ